MPQAAVPECHSRYAPFVMGLRVGPTSAFETNCHGLNPAAAAQKKAAPQDSYRINEVDMSLRHYKLKITLVLCIALHAPLAHSAEGINYLYLESKDQLRRTIMASDDADGLYAKPGSIIPDNGRPYAIIDNPGMELRNVSEMERQQLNRGAAREQPWSDSYWAIGRGLLASRYATPNQTNKFNWLRNHSIFLSTPARDIATDDLSPAEKYDLLVGDAGFSLTNYMWAQGQRYQSSIGFVPSWMGICHGWAAAAHMQPPPLQAISVPAPDGTPIRFFISDIKGLLSGLWAGAMPAARFVGERCRQSRPPRDDGGHIIAPDCFDTNPASWHIAVINQVGRNRRSIIMDATFSHEVWNHPIATYSYSYFNPETLEPSLQIRGASIPLQRFTSDRFKSYRSRDTASVIGINMAVTYITEMTANHDSSQNDSVRKSIHYLYDLELDARGDIIGGEWYQDAHPDFLWSFSPSASPQSIGDRLLSGTWDGQSPVPPQWRAAAPASSAKGQPLAHVIQKLLQISRQGFVEHHDEMAPHLQ